MTALVVGLPGFVDLYFVSVIAFCGFLAYLVYRDRKNIEFHFILLIRKTQRGKRAIDRIAQLSPRFWKLVSTLYIIVAFYFMLNGLYMMGLAAKLVAERALTVPALQFIMPLPMPQPISGPGYLLVPFWFWIVLIPFFMFPHEISHGIIARAHKIKLKSVGGMLLAVIPGAFVEPDDRQLNREKPLVKLRVYSAGSIANLITVSVVLALTVYCLWPSIAGTGLTITYVNSTMPAGIAGLKSGMRLQSIAGQPTDVTYSDFELAYTVLLVTSSNITVNNAKMLSTAVTMYNILLQYEPGDTVDVVADGSHYSVTLSGNPLNSSIPYMGLDVKMNEKRTAEFEFGTLLPLIWWVTTIGQAVAVFNLLPIYPLDGGLLVESVAEHFLTRSRRGRRIKREEVRRKAKKIAKWISIAMLTLIAFNFVGPFILRML